MAAASTWNNMPDDLDLGDILQQELKHCAITI